ncbi:Uncharacterised protein [Trueperella pyogenes]|nr:hypothetical protein [Trueperella pyogenes]SUO86862.1 Uncharacterised protein [Trueperella pyogenes]
MGRFQTDLAIYEDRSENVPHFTGEAFSTASSCRISARLSRAGLGAKTARYYIPTAFMREYVAILVKLKWIIIGLFGLFAAFIFLSL